MNSYIKQFSNEQLEEKYNLFLATIQDEFKDNKPRLDALLTMYQDEQIAAQLMLAPASAVNWYHNAYEGGYIDHVLHVLKTAKLMTMLLRKMGGTIDFTDEELAFVALHHDLGKVGFPGEPYYVPQTSDWHLKNRGEYFAMNENIDMKITVTDRALLMLNRYAVSYNEKEWLAIKTSDGMYDETNKYYLIANTPRHKLKTNLPHVIHWADHMASIVEYNHWVENFKTK